MQVPGVGGPTEYETVNPFASQAPCESRATPHLVMENEEAHLLIRLVDPATVRHGQDFLYSL
jgi:hypothetical protein